MNGGDRPASKKNSHLKSDPGPPRAIRLSGRKQHIPMHTQCPPPATSAVTSDQVVARKVVLHTVEYHRPTTAKNIAGAAQSMTFNGSAAMCTAPESRPIAHIPPIHQSSVRTLKSDPHHFAQTISPVES